MESEMARMRNGGAWSNQITETQTHRQAILHIFRVGDREERTVYSLNRQILYDVEINVFAFHKSGLLCWEHKYSHLRHCHADTHAHKYTLTGATFLRVFHTLVMWFLILRVIDSCQMTTVKSRLASSISQKHRDNNILLLSCLLLWLSHNEPGTIADNFSFSKCSCYVHDCSYQAFTTTISLNYGPSIVAGYFMSLKQAYSYTICAGGLGVLPQKSLSIKLIIFCIFSSNLWWKYFYMRENYVALHVLL